MRPGDGRFVKGCRRRSKPREKGLAPEPIERLKNWLKGTECRRAATIHGDQAQRNREKLSAPPAESELHCRNHPRKAGLQIRQPSGRPKNCSNLYIILLT